MTPTRKAEEELKEILQEHRPCHHQDYKCWDDISKVLMVWHSSRAGRPSKFQLEEAITNNTSYKAWSNMDARIMTPPQMHKLVDALLSLYPEPETMVTREQVLKCIESCRTPGIRPYPLRLEIYPDDLVTSLLALFGVREEPAKPEWCEHCYIAYTINGKRWWKIDGVHGNYLIPDDWKHCPLCSTPRPTEERRGE